LFLLLVVLEMLVFLVFLAFTLNSWHYRLHKIIQIIEN
jgi:hypothetical protein